MKRFEFPLDDFQLSRLLSSFRSKKDIIVMWMNCLKIISTYSRPTDAAAAGLLILHVDKMSRIFIESGVKSFSTVFPFSIRENAGLLEFGSAACPLIDNKITSDILSLINSSNVLSARDVMGFAEPLMDISGEQEVVWEFLRDLMICDDGYLRVDHDPANQNGKFHPLNHVDVFYSQSATFKLGLRDRATIDDFQDILNIRSECHFLGPG